MTLAKPIRFPSGQLTSVYLEDGFKDCASPYGSSIQVSDAVELSEKVLFAVITKNGRLSANEVAFLREKLDLFQAELAERLGVESQTVSLWERDSHKIPKACDVLLRLSVCDLLSRSQRKQLGAITVGKLTSLAGPIAEATYFASRTENHWEVRQLQYTRYRTFSPESTHFPWNSGATPQVPMTGAKHLVARSTNSEPLPREARVDARIRHAPSSTQLEGLLPYSPSELFSGAPHYSSDGSATLQ